MCGVTVIWRFHNTTSLRGIPQNTYLQTSYRKQTQTHTHMSWCEYSVGMLFSSWDSKALLPWDSRALLRYRALLPHALEESKVWCLRCKCTAVLKGLFCRHSDFHVPRKGVCVCVFCRHSDFYVPTKSPTKTAVYYEVASISRLLKIIGLFCRHSDFYVPTKSPTKTAIFSDYMEFS